MNMNIRDVGKTAVIDIAKDAINKIELAKIEEFLKTKNSKTRVAINLKNVNHIDYDFTCLLKKQAKRAKLSLFGLNNNILLNLFVSQSDRLVDLYLDEQDFNAEKNAIVYRRLKLLKSA